MSHNYKIMVTIFNILIFLLSHRVIFVSCDPQNLKVADSSIDILDNNHLRIPKITIDQFDTLTKESTNKDDLELLNDAGGKLSVFSITDIGTDYKEALEAFYDEAPGCISNNNNAHEANTLHIPKEVKLPDGSTRRTFATEFKTYPNCLSKISIITRTFDEIDRRVSILLNKINNNEEGQVITSVKI